MKALRVGDPHVKVMNLDESARLMQFVLEQARLHKVDQIELLGDLFHTHSVIRLEVMVFWNHWLDVLSKEFLTIVLVGNHDQSGDYGSEEHALSVFKRLENKNLIIVDKPKFIPPFAYLPYIHDNEEFIKAATQAAEHAEFLVCHATFDGSKYDNGMYAPGGIDPLQVPFKTILSGHIHALQRYKTISGKEIIYPGTARWDSNSDINQVKGIWIFEHDNESGAILKEEMIPTNKVCTPILGLEWKEGDPEPEIVPGSRTTIELIGSSDWIAKQKTKLKGKASIQSRFTDKKTDVRTAGNSLQEFMDKILVTSLNKADLMAKAKEWGLV